MNTTNRHLDLGAYRLVPLAAALCVLLSLLGTPAVGQIKWFRYGGNPVLDVGPAFSWDPVAAAIERVVVTDTVYHMWYTGGPSPSSDPQIGYATSGDGGITWTKHASNPVLSPTSGAWDNAGVARPDVLSSDWGFRMWYTGLAGSIFRIGYATSTDGVAWSKRFQPVLDVDSGGTWNRTGVLLPSIVEQGDTLRMWYQGDPGFRFGFATATDDTSWTPHPSNPVLVDDKAYYQRVRYNGDLYEMWYTVGNHPDSQIKYASSPDGVDWAIHPEPVLHPGRGYWEIGGILPGDIHFDGSIYHLWFQGFSSGRARMRSGYAISPKGLNVSITPTHAVFGEHSIVVRVDKPTGLRFSAEITQVGVPPDTLQLFDDGLHGDSLARDGVFASSWIPAEGDYVVHLRLMMRDTLQFEMRNAVSLRVATSFMDERSELPHLFVLGQNYPNPFNPSTTIEYVVPEPTHVVLSIFDLLGRQIATLVDGSRPPGRHEAHFDASGVPGGTYFYRMEAGDVVRVRKMTLLR